MQFLLAISSEPGTNYNVTLSDTFRVEGKGEFCLPDNLITEAILGRGLEDGLDLTLQVQMNGHPRGGLYACGNLRLTSESTTPPPTSVCKNSTGVTAIPFEGIAAHRNANVSTADGHAQGSEGTDHEHGHGHGHEHHNSSTASSINASDAIPEPADPTSEAMRMAAWEVMSLAVMGGNAIWLTGALGA
ncbi:putative GPI anchored protein [Aspergillus stella-maris]|uniref:putative GPI anchored protein n=1 Tax=Aspergillus stella-maris TaxID=1810926 RepID=UPI003CCD7B93